MAAADPTRVLDTRGMDTKPSPFKPAGAPGAIVYSGFLVEEEKDPRLVGREKYRTYANILANTTIVAAGCRYFLNLIGKAGWRVEPADESAEAQRLAELVEDIMNSMVTPWNKVVRRAAMSRFYGFSIQEHTLVRRKKDGVVGYKDIEPRPQLTIERWDVDMTGTVLGVVQRRPQDQKELYLPRSKVIYMVDDSLNDSPEGLGLFRHLAKAAHRLETYELLEGWAFQRDLRGTPVGRGPLAAIQARVDSGEISVGDANIIKKPIEDFIQKALKGKDTGIFIESAVYKGSGESQTPSATRQWDVELLQGANQGHEAVAAAIMRINREMARVLGVEHLLLGESSSGSFALSRDKTQAFGLIVDSTLTEIKETFEADFLDPLWMMNGWDDELRPTFKIEQIQYRDIEQVTTALEQLAKAGAPLGLEDPAVNEVRQQLGLSDAPETTDLDLSPRGLPPPGEEPAEEDEEDMEPAEMAKLRKIARLLASRSHNPLDNQPLRQ